MKIMTLFSLLVCLNGVTSAGAQALFPEDGSQKIGTWYYSYRHMPEGVIQAFEKEGARATRLKYPYFYLQDISVFDDQGAFLFQGPSVGYGSDLTMGVYEKMGSYSETKRVSWTDITGIISNTGQLNLAFFEGGGLISGRFANGEAYVIMNYMRYDHLKYAADFPVETQEELNAYHQALAKDLRVKPENLIVIRDPRFINQHLDLYIKALPNGVLLIDDPTQALNVLNTLQVQSPESQKALDLMKVFYTSDRFKDRRQRYEDHIQGVKESLQKYFKVVSVPARFFSVEAENGNFEDHVNFLNSVSSINSENKNYFITNRSPLVPELEDFWAQKLKPFGFAAQNIHFVGSYSDGAGLDCYGVPSP